MPQFKRPHHRRIARVLSALDGSRLRDHHCLFGGGTAIALRFGEYRESVGIDFLVSGIDHYRNLRQMLRGPEGISPLLRAGSEPWIRHAGIRADQYGIRTEMVVDDQPIKFEIVLEGRMTLETPAAEDALCGIASLTPLDMAASKLLANSDRWADDGVFSRDVIDLAMMEPSLPLLRKGMAKAEGAYGDAVRRDLEKAVVRLQQRQAWLERCMQVLAMEMPRAVLWSKIRALLRVLD